MEQLGNNRETDSIILYFICRAYTGFTFHTLLKVSYDGIGTTDKTSYRLTITFNKD